MARSAHGWGFPRRGDVHVAKLDKKRPVIIISADFLNRHALDISVIPVTSIERPTFRYRVLLPAGVAGLRRKSWAKCDGVITIERASILFPALGTLSAVLLREVEEQVKAALDLP